MKRQGCQIRGFRQAGFRVTGRHPGGSQPTGCKGLRQGLRLRGQDVTSALRAGEGLAMEWGGV